MKTKKGRNSSKILKKTITLQKEKQKEESENKYKNNWKTSNKLAISTYLSVVTLNVSGLTAPIERHRAADWIKKDKNLLYVAYKRLT